MKGRIIGDWTFEDLLDRGGQGAVYQAQHRLLKSSFAIKVVQANSEGSEEAERWGFSREAEIAASLAHPNIARAYIPFEVEDEGVLCLPMERLVGESLSKRLRREKRKPWDVDEAISVVKQACEALAFAHAQGVVHRDIKPSNIFLVDGGVVKVLDFGLARSAEATQTDHKGVKGTLPFFAPELLSGSSPSPGSDVYGLGAVLYRLLTGQLPVQINVKSPVDQQLRAIVEAHRFGIARVDEVVEGVSKTVADIVAQLIAGDPDKRPSDGSAALRILQGGLRSDVIAEPVRSASSVVDQPTEIRDDGATRQTPIPEATAPVVVAHSPIKPIDAESEDAKADQPVVPLSPSGSDSFLVRAPSGLANTVRHDPVSDDPGVDRTAVLRPEGPAATLPSFILPQHDLDLAAAADSGLEQLPSGAFDEAPDSDEGSSPPESEKTRPLDLKTTRARLAASEATDDEVPEDEVMLGDQSWDRTPDRTPDRTSKEEFEDVALPDDEKTRPPDPAVKTNPSAQVVSEIGIAEFRSKAPILVGLGLLLFVVVVGVLFAALSNDTKSIQVPAQTGGATKVARIKDSAPAAPVAPQKTVAPSPRAIVPPPPPEAKIEETAPLEVANTPQPEDEETPVPTAVREARPKKSQAARARRSRRKRDASRLAREGERHLLSGKLDVAQESLEKCIKYNPRLARCYRSLGVLYARTNRTQKSIASYYRYLSLAPDAPDADRIRSIVESL